MENPTTFDWTNPTVQLVLERVQRANITKITSEHTSQSRTLIDVAEYYARTYRGTFDFMLSLQTNLTRWGKLTPGQAAGALNCMLAENKRLSRNKPQWSMPEADLPKDLPEAPTPQILSGPIEQAAHNGTYTIVLNEKGDYRTIRIVDAPEQMGKPQGTQVAQFLSGADNEHNYTGFAFVSGSRIGIWSKFKADSVLAKALNILLTADKEQQADYGQAYAIESNNCWRCGRRLTVPASVGRGLGPICAEKLGY